MWGLEKQVWKLFCSTSDVRSLHVSQDFGAVLSKQNLHFN